MIAFLLFQIQYDYQVYMLPPQKDDSLPGKTFEPLNIYSDHLVSSRRERSQVKGL